MQVLLILFASLLGYRALGLLGIDALNGWIAAARPALSTMLAFTAAAHFNSARRDLIAMVPPSLPRPDLLVTLTGVAEAAGAIGLLLPPVRGLAAIGLAALFVALLPANISAARREPTLRGRPATALWLRIPMQILFIVWAVAVR